MKLINNVFGQISIILITIPNYLFQSYEGLKKWKSVSVFLLKLSKDIRVTLITHEANFKILDLWLIENFIISKVNIVTVPNSEKLTLWTQDTFLVTQSKEIVHHILYSKLISFSKYAANIFNYDASVIPLKINGGNILVGEDILLLGGNSFDKNYSKEAFENIFYKRIDSTRKIIWIENYKGIPYQRIEDFKCKNEIWTQVLYYGNKARTVQPIFHIDMFISIAGKDENGKHIVIIGNPILPEIINTHKNQKIIKPLINSINSIVDNLSKVNALKILRVPLPLIFHDDVIRKIRFWYFATTNNCLVEIDEFGNKKVWLPEYGFEEWESLREIDIYTQKIWEEIGFEVLPLGNFHPIAQSYGGINCIVKCMSRN